MSAVSENVDRDVHLSKLMDMFSLSVNVLEWLLFNTSGQFHGTLTSI